MLYQWIAWKHSSWWYKMHLDMNKDLLSMNNYMQVPRITPKPPVSILKTKCHNFTSFTCHKSAVRSLTIFLLEYFVKSSAAARNDKRHTIHNKPQLSFPFFNQVFLPCHAFQTRHLCFSMQSSPNIVCVQC